MQEKNEHLDALHDIRNMMERSSRFISLSGLSGIAAGCCALGAAYYIWSKFESYPDVYGDGQTGLGTLIVTVGSITFVTALLLAFVFTYTRSRKTGIPIWGSTAQRLLINTAIPLAIGGIVAWRMLETGLLVLVPPICLLFYGLALINGSKYTLREVRWLGFCQLALGVWNLWELGYGLYFWAIGFGVLHILYGVIMWWKYEKR